MSCEDNAIPASWVWVDIGGLGVFLGGGTPAKSVKEYWDSADIPWVSPKDMKQNDIHSAEMSVSKKALDKTSLSRIPKGSLIMVTRSGILSRTFPVAINHCDVVINQDLKALIPFSGVNAKFLMLMCQYFTHQILADCSKQGTTVASINTSSLQGFKVPLAPSPEQRRIVAKIEALFSEIDHGVEELKAAQQKLKRARQALLKAAFEGKLTARWRAENPDKLESPEALRRRIQAEREAYHRRQLEEWEKAVEAWKASGSEGRRPRKPRLDKIINNPFFDNCLNDNEIPDSWVWLQIGNVSSGPEYGTSSKSSPFGDVPVVRMGNLQKSRIDWTDLVYSSDRDEVDGYTLYPGDILFNRTNSPELVGKAAIYRGERPAIFAGYLIRVNHINSIVNSEYLNYFFASGLALQQGAELKTDGVNQSNINGKKLASYYFPCCSMDEQEALVNDLDSKMSEIDQMEVVLQVSLQRAESLKQSILKQAFSGRLVSQDPEDEPVSELLARIRAEREAQQQAAPRRRRRKPAAEATP